MEGFQYKEDYNYFLEKLANSNESLFQEKYLKLFDFRDPSIKRKEFNNIRNDVFNELVLRCGRECQLKLHTDCSKDGLFDVDHYIPLSSNKLNKEIRNMKAVKGKKVLSQSFGSNDISNFKIACKRCNSFKKHNFLFD